MRFSFSMPRVIVLVACVLLAGSAHAETSAAPDSSPTAKDAEFARFVEQSLARKPAPAPPAKAAAEPAATCEATTAGAQNVARMKQLEAELSRLRAQQAAKWKQNGWTEKEAAAAGEPVVLNGSGYNIKSGMPGR